MNNVGVSLYNIGGGGSMSYVGVSLCNVFGSRSFNSYLNNYVT